MNLNEDGTITLSQAETQKFVTKVINPEYKQMERMKRFYTKATTSDISNVSYRLNQVEKKCNSILDYIKLKTPFSARTINDLTKELGYLNWCLNGQADQYESEEAQEIEKAYNLYKMLLKHRRFKPDE